ncbi:MAG: hypothetical protein GEU96_14590 [Propionibacteriales bacterium]|nr:hypothetical protein [Propionibacteriales bacterium]
MRRRTTRLMALLLAISTVGVTASLASASTSSVRSEPNGDVRVTVSLGCGGSDRDKDGDFNTCGKGDTAVLFHAVINQSDVAQTIRVDYALDGPGTTFDRTSTVDVSLQPDAIYDVRETFRVENKSTPLGAYTLTIAASGSESATTSASFTVHD